MPSMYDTLRELSKMGNIGVKSWGSTALSALTDVQIGGASFEFPSDAKCLLCAMPTLTSPAGNTANEPVAAKVKIQSTSNYLGDCTFLAQPIGSSLLKSSAQPQGAQENAIYPLFCPVKGGSKIDIYGTGLLDHTIEPRVGITIWFSDFMPDPVRYPQTHWVVGVYTNTSTAAAEVVGSKISIIGGRRIIEVGGFAVGTTVAALKGLLSQMRLNSSDILAFGDLMYFLNPASGQVDTNIVECNAGVTRIPCSIPIKDKATIADNHKLEVALTTTGNFVVQIGYI
jgi:hypothetical protein